MPEGTIHAVGKRKSAVARVWIRPGRGLITINKRPLDEYVLRESDKDIATLSVLKALNRINYPM